MISRKRSIGCWCLEDCLGSMRSFYKSLYSYSHCCQRNIKFLQYVRLLPKFCCWTINPLHKIIMFRLSITSDMNITLFQPKLKHRLVTIITMMLTINANIVWYIAMYYRYLILIWNISLSGFRYGFLPLLKTISMFSFSFSNSFSLLKVEHLLS